MLNWTHMGSEGYGDDDEGCTFRMLLSSCFEGRLLYRFISQASSIDYFEFGEEEGDERGLYLLLDEETIVYLGTEIK